MRYSRLEALDGVGEKGIEKLKNGRVFVIGCGALGSMAAMYLAASGVGKIGIADFDTVDLSNLQRQLFFDESNLGQSKSSVLKHRMRDINSEIEINEYGTLVNEKLAMEIFPDYDFIIDGSDNPSTKHMTSCLCEKLGKPYCIGGVRQFGGQVMSWARGHAGYKDLFGDIPECTGLLPCSVGGVLGPAAGVVASVQAGEAIKHLTGAGKMLYDKLFTFDLADANASILGF